MEISPRVFESLQRDTVLYNRLLEVRVNNLFFFFSLKLRWLLHAIGTSFVLKILICIIFRIRIAKKWKIHFISSNTFKSVKHLDKKEKAKLILLLLSFGFIAVIALNIDPLIPMWDETLNSMFGF